MPAAPQKGLVMQDKGEQNQLELLAGVDVTSSVAVYLQIENHVQFAIASGRLKSGDQLPSVRELSERLQVNPNTVAKAYRDLEVMGLLFTRRGLGIFVNKGIDTQCREECRRRIIARFHEVVSEAHAAGMPLPEISEVVDKSYELNGGPYSDTPAALMALAKEPRLR
jgi:GntR family transcriptional regulator